VASNLTNKYGATLNEPPTTPILRSAFEDRDDFLLATTPGAAGHLCRMRAKSSRVHTLELNYGVTAHLHDTEVMCM
jgi:hypothetical protein